MRSPSTGTVEGSSSALFPVVSSGRSPGCNMPVEGLRMDQAVAHEPVLRDVVVALFAAVPPGVVVDATVGEGGHAEGILEAHPGLCVLGIDRDPEAITAAGRRLAPFRQRVVLHRALYGDLVRALPAWRAAGPPAWPRAASEPAGLSGLLLDLGLSSAQLDRPELGFSYQRTGPLDMRMDPEVARTAAEITNVASEEDLAALFAAHGEGRLARRIARAIVAARPIVSTTELAEVVAGAVPVSGRRRGHPARRVFQALRVAVNDELEQLAALLPAALELLAPGGRAVCIAYHSGEDRVVKEAFRGVVQGVERRPRGLPQPERAEPRFQLVFRGARRPVPAEVARNPRASAARLRAVERLRPPVEGRSTERR